LQDGAPPLLVRRPPLLDFLQRSKATQAIEVIVQATIAYARRLNGAVDSARRRHHCSKNSLMATGYRLIKTYDANHDITGQDHAVATIDEPQSFAKRCAPFL
jgi:hypothetical protein